MGSPKKTSTTENQYQFFQKPEWGELNDLKGWNPQADPTIAANYGNQQNELARSFVSPTGSYQTPELREQQMRSGIQQIGQNQATATRADQYGQNAMKLGQLGTAAQLGAPQFAQTKGTTTEQTKGGFWSNLLNTGLNAGIQAAASFI